MVVDALGDEQAPIYILRLWAHCQARKSDRFAMPPAGLKAQCRAPGDAIEFERALTDAGFVVRDGESVHVLGWAEQNAALLAAWENGAKGGRPPKKPKQNPRVTTVKPTGNPAVTHGEPSANPDETDKSREEKISPDGDSFGQPADAGKPDGRPPAKTALVWEAYRTAYRDRYDADPVRNAMVNGQLSQVVARLGEDAPRVAAFYVAHPAAFYVQAGHSVALLLRDAEKLCTEWRTGKTMAPGPPRGVPQQGRYAAAGRTLFGPSQEPEVIDVEAR